ncbi:MAG: inner membrane protein YpjD, partial [Telluria sp.]|nr:inner membrane protein YpjD [Telluria sp.]
MPNAFVFLAALLYALCAFLPLSQRRLVSAGVMLGWLLHAVALCSEALPAGGLRLGFATVLSATLWISVGAWWFENRNMTLDGLRVLVLPCAAIAVALPAIFPGTVVPLAGKSGLFSWHIAIAMLAYSTLTIAAFHAVLMALQESRLHHRGAPQGGWFGGAIDRLP